VKYGIYSALLTIPFQTVNSPNSQIIYLCVFAQFVYRKKKTIFVVLAKFEEQSPFYSKKYLAPQVENFRKTAANDAHRCFQIYFSCSIFFRK